MCLWVHVCKGCECVEREKEWLELVKGVFFFLHFLAFYIWQHLHFFVELISLLCILMLAIFNINFELLFQQRLVVCLEESLYIHNIRDMKVLHTIRDTPPNPTGLCALSISNDNCFLAYPGSNTIGQVQIFDAQNLVRINLNVSYKFFFF